MLCYVTLCYVYAKLHYAMLYYVMLCHFLKFWCSTYCYYASVTLCASVIHS